ncbi:OmpA family protein [Emticicia sp.]|uniref:OmpA family protein n=1 Tax=Emticicia sp. TaxID=1930953 RepID=UPI0037517FDB
MKLLKIVFFVFINSLVFSQTTFRSKITLSPHIGIGWAVPPFINGGISNLILRPNYFKNNIFGAIVTSSGDSRQVYKITNTLGIDANYSLNKTWSANIGINRAMHINLLNDPDPVRVSSTTQYSTWIFAYKYTSLLIGTRYTDNERFFQCNIHYAGNTKEAIENDNGAGGGGLTTNGNGLVTTSISKKTSTIIISPEYGVTGVSSFDFPMELSVGLHIPTAVFSKDKSTFIRNNANAGENTLRFTQAALWFRIRVPITIWTKKPKQIKQPVLKDEKIIPTPTKSVDYGGKKVTTGEKIILKSIQFEQAKAILTPAAMSELDGVQKLMEQSSTMVIEIIGHTSDEGDRNSNIELSLNRAKACKEYLVKQRIKSNRIKVRGMGPDSPISRIDKAQNRRVEMQIIKM